MKMKRLLKAPIAIICCLCILLAQCSVFVFADAGINLNSVSGDADGNGFVDIGDLKSAIRALAKGESIDGVDINGDGELSLSDLRLVFRRIAEQKNEGTDTPTFSISSVEASAGDTDVSIVVSLKNNPGIFDMILSFTYDSNVMTLKSVANGDVMNGATFMAPKNTASGCRATWYYMDEPDEYADGSVAILTFDIFDTATDGEYIVSVNYDDGDINNYDEEALSFETTNGMVRIVTSSHSHTPSNAVKENEISGTCKVQETYDEVIYCSACGEEISRIQKTGDYGTHNYENGVCTHCGGTDESDEAQFIVSKVTASAGDSIDVVVSVKNNPGIFDMILSFTYDSNAMTLKSVTNGEVMSDATFMAPKNMASGCRATWYYMDAPDEYKDGSVVILTFEIADTAVAGEYPVGIAFGEGDINNYDESPLAFVTTDGSITVA